MEKYLIMLIICSMVFVSGCDEEVVSIPANVEKLCFNSGTYCHLYRTNENTVNITFPNSTGVMEYRIE